MTDLETVRRGAVALAEFACGFDVGRSKDDPVYAAVTGGRDVGAMRARYSSCGDLAHWMLFSLGCRAEWINHSDAPHGWRVGMNLSLLAAHGALPGGADWAPEPGDVLVIWNSPTGSDGHVCVWLGGGVTANYGAGGMSAAASPGAKLARPALVYDGHGWKLGARKVQRHLSLAHVPLSLPAILPDGLHLSGEDYDALRGTLAS